MNFLSFYIQTTIENFMKKKVIIFHSNQKQEYVIGLSLIIKGVEYTSNLHKQRHCNKMVL
jgi:hypothetical protein